MSNRDGKQLNTCGYLLPDIVLLLLVMISHFMKNIHQKVAKYTFVSVRSVEKQIIIR